ncbi:MAG: biotin carboxyl carrier domain-containing protein [Chloroflexia bacterium]|nr:biotin carboxyl carrier domain-containing protein [Chloroflexia bacterium]
MSESALSVRRPGLLTTVQDLGRPGLGRFGVSAGGALDQGALILGNRLVGNEPGEAGLEISLIGPELVITGTSPVTIALTGANLGATRNALPLPRWESVSIAAGDVIAFAPDGGEGLGARAYLCVAGGFAIPPVMGSRATDLFGGFGGWQGRPLHSGDEVPLRGATGPLPQRRLRTPPPDYPSELIIRVVLGPQHDRFTGEARATLLSATYTVTPTSDRMGIRLSGPPLALTHGADMLSEGIALGAIQVPGDGAPIVLLRARQTIGGYPKIATVIGADLDALAQARPGDCLRFETVTVDQARAVSLAHQSRFGEDAIVTNTESAVSDAGAAVMAESWDPDGVRRLVEALATAGVTEFRFEIAGLTLELRRGEGEDALAPSSGARSGAEAEPDDVILAPVLGTFYRRPAPDAAPYLEPGAAVENGQAIGLIEVMKTFTEVTAPRAGILAAFLVEDGVFVEYGQPVARLAAAGEAP